MKEGESMYLAKVIKTGNRLYVYDAFNNKLATINSEKELFENTGGAAANGRVFILFLCSGPWRMKINGNV